MTDASPLQQLLADIRAHIAAGRKIEAIKLYRDATGAGLAEAQGGGRTDRGRQAAEDRLELVTRR
jgi:hypothetical protein